MQLVSKPRDHTELARVKILEMILGQRELLADLK